MIILFAQEDEPFFSKKNDKLGRKSIHLIESLARMSAHIIKSLVFPCLQIFVFSNNLLEKLIANYLEIVEPTIHSLEAVFNIIQHVALPQRFLNCYIYQWFDCCSKLKDVRKSTGLKLRNH